LVVFVAGTKLHCAVFFRIAFCGSTETIPELPDEPAGLVKNESAALQRGPPAVERAIKVFS